MENSNVSCDEKMADTPEESSWTFYIEGFMYDNYDNNNDDDHDRNSCFSSEFESPSLVSDAASSAVKKLISSGKSNCNSSRSIMCKQNSFKKKKNCKVVSVMDRDLEDTASSPVNSPKVSYMNQFMNQKDKAKMDVSEVQRNIFGKGGVFAVQRDNNCTELKRRTCD